MLIAKTKKQESKIITFKCDNCETKTTRKFKIEIITDKVSFCLKCEKDFERFIKGE